MAENTKATDQVAAAAVEAKDSIPKPKANRSRRDFPRYSIEGCRKVADVIKDLNAGNPWPPKEIANALELGMGNNFYYLTASARDYGLTTGARDSKLIEISDLGSKLVYPKSPSDEIEAAKEAFLTVDIFKKVFDHYQGNKLPEIKYLKNTLKTEFDLDEQFHDEFYKLYQENLRYLSKLESSVESDVIRATKLSSAPARIVAGKPAKENAPTAFVAMPFSEKTSRYAEGYFDEVLNQLIIPSAFEAGFTATTANKSGSEVIQSTIINDLDSADLVIVDLTEHNPNVLFELGMRIAFDKPVCLIRAEGTAPIFDVDQMLRVFDYNPNLWRSTLENDIPKLTEHVSQTWTNRSSERSYLNILRNNS